VSAFTCSNCGAANPATVDVCPRCGLPLDAPGASQRGATGVRPVKPSTAKAVFLLVAVIVAAAGGAGAWLLTSEPKRSESAPAPEVPNAPVEVVSSPTPAEATTPVPSAEQVAEVAPTPEPQAEAPAGTEVLGELPREIIMATMRQAAPSIRRCYESGLVRNPKLSGNVRVRFVIDPSGGVAVAADDDSDLPDKTVTTCVVKTVKQLSFPRPSGGPVVVRYPFKFSVSEDTGDHDHD
jgi:hypothetical protein